MPLYCPNAICDHLIDELGHEGEALCAQADGRTRQLLLPDHTPYGPAQCGPRASRDRLLDGLYIANKPSRLARTTEQLLVNAVETHHKLLKTKKTFFCRQNLPKDSVTIGGVCLLPPPTRRRDKVDDEHANKKRRGFSKWVTRSTHPVENRVRSTLKRPCFSAHMVATHPKAEQSCQFIPARRHAEWKYERRQVRPRDRLMRRQRWSARRVRKEGKAVALRERRCGSTQALSGKRRKPSP